MRKRNRFIPLVELKHADRNKYDRIVGLEPRYQIGSVFHPQKGTNRYVESLEDELIRIDSDGIKSPHDDLIDALASMLEIAFPIKSSEKRTHHYKSASYPA